mgnify:CR=1 FL=1
MQVWREVEVTINGRTRKVRALFDSGSSFTVMGYEVLKELFDMVEVKPLVKPREVVLVDGRKIVIDGYIDSQIMINGYMIEDRIYLSKYIARKVIVENRELHLPDLIIGAPTMETWGIELSLEKGDVIIRGGAFLF